MSSWVGEGSSLSRQRCGCVPCHSVHAGRTAWQEQMAGQAARGWLLPDFMAPPLCLGCAPGQDVAETGSSWRAPSMLFTRTKKEARDDQVLGMATQAGRAPLTLPAAPLRLAGGWQEERGARRAPCGGVRAGGTSPRHPHLPQGTLQRLRAKFWSQAARCLLPTACTSQGPEIIVLLLL